VAPPTAFNVAILLFFYFPLSLIKQSDRAKSVAEVMALFSRRKDPLHEANLEAEQTEAERPTVTEPESRPSRWHTIGQLLRETREGQGSDLNRVATALRIRAPYLEAIEEGRYDSLPGAVYALGFVRTYAIHLGLDGEEAVRRFKLEAAGFDGQRDLTFPVPLGERSIPGATLVMAAVILVICGYGLFYYLTSSARPRPEHVPAVPSELALPRAPVAALPPPSSEAPAAEASSIVSPAPSSSLPGELAAASAQAPVVASLSPPSMAPASPSPAVPEPALPAATAIAPAAPVQPAPAPPVPATATARPLAAGEAAPAGAQAEKPRIFGLANGPTRIVVHAVTDSWIQVHDKDNKAIFTRQLHAGDIYHVPDLPGLVMRTGSASGLAITVDSRAAPALRGSVQSNILLDPDRLLAGTAIVRAAAVRTPAPPAPVLAAPAPEPAPSTDPADEPAVEHPE
jgi:cytoskeleton protein RodZ